MPKQGCSCRLCIKNVENPALVISVEWFVNHFLHPSKSLYYRWNAYYNNKPNIQQTFNPVPTQMFWVGNFLGRWGKRFCLLCEKRGGGIMKETIQSFEKPLEKHCQKKLALTTWKNGYDQPHKRTHSSHPPIFVQKIKWQKWRLCNMDVWCNKT
jgi:hypothetical protein